MNSVIGALSYGMLGFFRRSIFWVLAPDRLIGFLVLFLFLFLRLQDPQILESIRNQSFDLYQQIQPREPAQVPITIVDIDEESLQKHGQWPWPRTLIAELIEKLARSGSIVTGFDIIFSEPDRLSPSKIAEDNKVIPKTLKDQLAGLPDNETVMANAMRSTRVVLGQTSVRRNDDKAKSDQPVVDAPHAKIGADPTPFLVKLPDLVQNLPELEEAATGRGVFSTRPDPDGVNRRVPLVMLVSGKVRLSLSAELLRIATGGESFAIKTSEAGIEGVVVARKLVNTDGNGRVWPYFAPIRPKRYMPVSSVLDGSADINKLRGHIILIGTSAVGLEDYRSIPLGKQVPGVEIHAQVIENIMTSSMLSRNSLAISFELFAILVFGILIILLVPRLGALVAFGFAATIIVATISVSWWYFISERELVDASWPTITFATLFVVAATGNYVREERQRQQIRGAFGQYLSPALVDQLSDEPDRLELGGETRDLSVLFTDVRGFTTISESYKDYPEGLTQLMNRFLNVLSQPILDQNGTIDKYMGDAIMAFWNAPLDELDHAPKACVAALTMMQDVDELNKKREIELADSEQETYYPINVGIGINTGTCVVGNMGSDNRFDYTALGDTVNLASRLEGQSKPYGVPIVIGSATADAVQDQMATFEIDLIRVKGKNEPVKIYALAGDETVLEDADFKAFRAMNRSMISAYRTQDWASAFEALEMMEGVGERVVGFDLSAYIMIYETRIAEFRENPPGKHWDGVYTATSK